MKRTILTAAAVTVLTFSAARAQYISGFTVEQGFVNSSIFWKAGGINGIGLDDMAQIAPGFYPDIWSNLTLNPALFPSEDADKLTLYTDFRTAREETVHWDAVPVYYAFSDILSYPYPYPQQENTATPTPLMTLAAYRGLSFGGTRLFLAGSWQLIYMQEPFYSPYYSIYNSRYGYDGSGMEIDEVGNTEDITDVYSALDEMTHEGHSISLHAGLAPGEKIRFGLTMNAVIYDREGEYRNLNSDVYRSTTSDWTNDYSKKATGNYTHTDLQFGTMLRLSSSLDAGFTLSYLKGQADQSAEEGTLYSYIYNTPDVSDEWSDYQQASSTEQLWDHPGNRGGAGFNLEKRYDRGRSLSLWYRYGRTHVDLGAESVIQDTSSNSSRWVNEYDNSWSEYWGDSYLKDLRSSVGDRDMDEHSAGIVLRWNDDPKRDIRLGVVFFYNHENSLNSETVVIDQYSGYYNTCSEDYCLYSYVYSLKESKKVEWTTTSTEWGLHIPLMADLKMGDMWKLQLGFDKVFRTRETENIIVENFDYREVADDEGITFSGSDFSERYSFVPVKETNNDIEFFINIQADLTEDITVNLHMDPELQESYGIAQWFLALRARF